MQPMIFKVRAWLPPMLCVLYASVVSCGNEGTVQPERPVPARIALSVYESTLTAVGQTLQITATVLDSEGRAVQGAVVTWTSSNPSVVNVDESGLATALINGWVQVSVASGGVNAVSSIVVMQVPASIEVIPPSTKLGAPGETVRLAYAVYDGNGVPIPGAGVVWSSADHAVATVSATGLVTAVGRGSTRIAASSDDVRGEASIMVAGVAGSAAGVMISP